jgi:hypothetical protein
VQGGVGLRQALATLRRMAESPSTPEGITRPSTGAIDRGSVHVSQI